MKVPGKSANEPTWFQLLSHVCSFYGVGTVKAGKKVVDNWGLTLGLFPGPFPTWEGTYVSGISRDVMYTLYPYVSIYAFVYG